MGVIDPALNLRAYFEKKNPQLTAVGKLIVVRFKITWFRMKQVSELSILSTCNSWNYKVAF